MKATKIIQPQNKPHLKVVRNGVKKTPKVYINTLMPNFSYTNEKGEIIIKDNCIKM